ncbi:MAG: electron transfer flavoprotein subunit alpha/FixB family protein [Azoarcus sp.]|jgi:electron transfer flavoprotein alpha subunit|nr:electron transfer flavoprotein subunit alpha/FixB family protein [Azoarcus sp.]
MKKRIWVHAEVTEGRIAHSACELLSKAGELAGALGEDTAVEATLIGSGLADEARHLAAYGAQTIHLADAPSLKFYSPVTHVPILADWASAHAPDIYLFAATATGSALGPAVAARLKTGMAAHCVDLRINEAGKLAALVPSFGGKVIGEILCPEKRPQMASVKPGIFAAKAKSSACPVRIEKPAPSAWQAGNASLEVVRIERQPPRGLPLSEANVVVCGGFGVGSREKWALLEQLAEYLGGATACTRPAVDEGWAEEQQMVGTSGRSIRPKVYLGFGVSGATHHICGMSQAGVVLSVNRDEEAPIFPVSDYRVVADVNEILPLLVEAVRPRTPGSKV